MGAGAATGARGGRAEGSGALGPACGAGGQGDAEPGAFVYPVRPASENLKAVRLGSLPPHYPPPPFCPARFAPELFAWAPRSSASCS